MVQKLAIGINLILAILTITLSLFVGEVLMSGIEWVGITVWTSILLGLLAYTYGEMKKLNLRQIIISFGLSLIVATPVGGAWAILSSFILFEFGMLTCRLEGLACLGQFIWIFCFGAIGGGIFALIMSVRYFRKNPSRLTYSAITKQKLISISISIAVAFLTVWMGLILVGTLDSYVVWIGVIVWSGIVFGLLVYIYGQMKNLKLWQIIYSVVFSLIFGVPITVVLTTFLAVALINYGILPYSTDFTSSQYSFLAFWFGGIGGALLGLILSIRYFKNSGLKPSSSEKRKNNEKTKRY
ncbi:MAG: hypothetical protein Phog2KO_30560 [Phototrophicaceae bacterium]